MGMVKMQAYRIVAARLEHPQSGCYGHTRGGHGGSMKYLVVAAMLALAACNTIGGVGDDLQSAGEAVSKAAK